MARVSLGVYYEDFQRPPPGARFDQEWGLGDHVLPGIGTRGQWQEFDPGDVKSAIYSLANSPDLEPARSAARHAAEVFGSARDEAASVLEVKLSRASDPFLSQLKGGLEKLQPLSAHDVARQWSPTRHVITRDTVALGQGNLVPPHIEVVAEVVSITHSFDICEAAAGLCRKAASHLERKNRRKVGTKVFIGHGGSAAWHELKDFVRDRLGLPWDEFNRVPVAGLTNIARLSEMLDAAAIAFLVLTAEDEMAGGDIQSRMNVVHEAGLFQGRLGFTKAIVLLEEGCKEFSNIQGLGQIRFPKGRISAVFEDVRRVVEREELLSLRELRTKPNAPAPKAVPMVRPHYEAWRDVDEFTVEQAACLWEDIEPHAGVRPTKVAARIGALCAAIKKGELGFVPNKAGGDELGQWERRVRRQQLNANSDTRVSRDQLADFAKAKGYHPKFLE
jgi:hypothetical protein